MLLKHRKQAAGQATHETKNCNRMALRESSRMRFRIYCPCLWRLSSYRIHVQDTVIPVWERSSKLSWTWWDGTDYTLVAPPYNTLKSCYWHIMSKERSVCSRLMVFPTSLKAFLRSYPPRGEWDLNGQLVFAKGGGARCCWMFPRYQTLQLCNGRRLALWCTKLGRIEGVLRGSLPEELVPVVFGMILAEFQNIIIHSPGGDAD